MNFKRLVVFILSIAVIILAYAIYYEYFSKQFPLPFRFNLNEKSAVGTPVSPPDSRKLDLNPAAAYLSDAYLSNSEAVILGRSENDKVICLLTLENLPKTSILNPGLIFDNKAFNCAVLSPDFKKVAFSVAGQNSWAGVLDTATSSLTGLVYVENGNIGKLLWSPDNTYLAASVFNNNGTLVIKVADVGNAKIVTEFGSVDKRINAYEPQWSPSGVRIAYKMKIKNTGQIKEAAYDFLPEGEKPVTQTAGAINIKYFQKQLAGIEYELNKYDAEFMKKGTENQKELNTIINRLLKLLKNNIGDGCCNRVKNILNKRDDDYPEPYQEGIKYSSGYKEFTYERFMDMMKTGEHPAGGVGVETTISDACEGLGALNNKKAIPALRQRVIKELDKLIWNNISEEQVNSEAGEPEMFSVLISASRALVRLTDTDKKLRYRPHYFHMQY